MVKSRAITTGVGTHMRARIPGPRVPMVRLTVFLWALGPGYLCIGPCTEQSPRDGVESVMNASLQRCIALLLCALLGQESTVLGVDEYKCVTPHVSQQAVDIFKRFYCNCHDSKHILNVQFVPIAWGVNGVCLPMASEPSDGDATALEDLSFSVTDAVPEMYQSSRPRPRRAITDMDRADMDTSDEPLPLAIEDSGFSSVAARSVAIHSCIKHLCGFS